MSDSEPGPYFFSPTIEILSELTILQ